MEILNWTFIAFYTVSQVIAASDECYFGFCNKTENYPYQKIQSALAGSDKYKVFFDTSIRNEVYSRQRKEVSNRYCSVKSIGLYPKLATNIKGDVLTVVNTEEYPQFIRYEQCLEPYCKSRMKFSKLAVFDNITSRIYLDRFPVSMGCYVDNVDLKGK